MLFKFVFAKSSRRHQGVKSSDQSFANLKRFALSIKTRFDCKMTCNSLSRQEKIKMRY